MAGPFTTLAGPIIRAVVIGDVNMNDTVTPYPEDVPATAEVGDLLLGFVGTRRSDSNASTCNQPAGWQVAPPGARAATGLSGGVGPGSLGGQFNAKTDRVLGGDPTSYSWTEIFVGGNIVSGMILPIGLAGDGGVVDSAITLDTTGSSASVVCPTLTPSKRGLLIHAAFLRAGGTNVTNLNGDTYIMSWLDGSTLACVSFDPAVAQPGVATGTKTIVFDASGGVRVGISLLVEALPLGGGWGSIPL
jgi:hypothetical protein